MDGGRWFDGLRSAWTIGVATCARRAALKVNILAFTCGACHARWRFYASLCLAASFISAGCGDWTWRLRRDIFTMQQHTRDINNVRFCTACRRKRNHCARTPTILRWKTPIARRNGISHVHRGAFARAALGDVLAEHKTYP